jgi:heme-binding protein
VTFARLTPARTAAAAIVAAVVIQLIPVKRDNPPAASEVGAPADVRRILERSCYDCHSNRTRWPWYSHVAPVSWMVARDVHLGRKELNFSDWPVFDFEEQEHLLADVAKDVERGSMPLWNYAMIHEDARLSAEDRRRVATWARGK